MNINSLNSLQANYKNSLKHTGIANQNTVDIHKSNSKMLSTALEVQGLNNIAFQGLNPNVMANVGKKLAPLALLAGMMFASPTLNAQTNSASGTAQEVVNTPKPFKLTAKQRELNTKIFAYEIVDMLINAEKREKYVVESANKDISNNLWILNDDVKLADSTLTLDKFIAAVENSKVKGVPKAFSDINHSHLDSLQKNKLIEDIKGLKDQNFKDLVDLNIPDSLNNVLVNPDAIKERKDAVDELLKEINSTINVRTEEKKVQESVVATCNKTIIENLERKKQVLELKDNLAKTNIDTTNFGNEVVVFEEAIATAQETNIEALKIIAEHTLVLEKLNILKSEANIEANRLSTIIAELDDIAKFKEEAEELRLEKFSAEEKDLEKTTKDAKAYTERTKKSLNKQSGKTNTHTNEASSDGKVRKSTQKSYDKRNKKTKSNAEKTAAIVNILSKKQEIVDKHNNKMIELNQLKGIVEETEE